MSGSSNNRNVHKRFANVAAFVNELGGDKAHVIEKVLIANNGNAAIKAIRSIRKWAYDIFGDESAIQFVVMATPEDLRANAEYIRMGDVIVDVPGGSNNHNYANVNLIVELARLHGVNAVWAGWGHASENPLLPDTLAKCNIKFIGPAGPPMRALGDKIGSTIIAQTAGVPCIAWNGDEIFANYDRETGCLPDDAFDQACIKSATDAYEAATKIGFPVMIKASEGGGGKGIRMVAQAEDVQNAYRQVSGEVPGSPIFIMKLSKNSRHLEVQLLADEYGDAIALNGRDCSVQRRHQKIIEEGPPIAAPPNVWVEMEKAAVALAKAVGYANAGTVEYLFSEADHKFYFLELNPRLQVEHPVTEMITGVNLPAAQLQVAMGIKLCNIPDIRKLYGSNKFEDDYSTTETNIDFSTVPRNPPSGHCIAVRITAENAEAGFKPTSGGIQELNFRSTPSVWGYFSMDSSGSIHEFADSQFGHLFANGTDREEARRNMVLALKELSIRGDISTTVDYISKLIELDDFVNNNINTGWLDMLIKANVDGIGSAAVMKRSNSFSKISDLSNDTNAVIGALILAYDGSVSGEEQFTDALNKGQLPSQSLLDMEREVELILGGVKYKLLCKRNAEDWFTLSVANSKKAINANIRGLSDGGYLTEVGGKSRVAYLTNKGDAATGMRISIGRTTISFSPDYDPTCLRTDVAGKLVKKLVPDGAHLEKGDAYCEIEVMKMFMPLKVSESGTITWEANEGAALGPGDLIASLELDNPENVKSTTLFEGELAIDGLEVKSQSTNTKRPHLQLRKAFEKLSNGIAGYVLSESEMDEAMKDLAEAISDPMLPVYEIDEPLSVLSGRLDADLFGKLTNEISDFRAKSESGTSAVEFPAESFCQMISDHAETLHDPTEKSAFLALVKPVVDAAAPYAGSGKAGSGGPERVLQGFLHLLRKWIDAERWFCSGKPYADAVDILRRSNKDNFQHVLEVCRSHGGFETSKGIVLRIIDAIADAMKAETSDRSAHESVVAGAQSLSAVVPCLSEIGSMGSFDYSLIALKARKLLLQESLPSLEERKSRISQTVQSLGEAIMSGDGSTPSEVSNFINENVPLADVLGPLLKINGSEAEKVALMELYMRQQYRTQKLGGFKRDVDQSCVKFTQTVSDVEKVFNPNTALTDKVDLKRKMSSSNLIEEAIAIINDDMSEIEDDDNASESFTANIVFKLTSKLEEIQSVEAFEKLMCSFPQYKKNEDKCVSGPKNTLYVMVLDEEINQNIKAMDERAKQIEGVLAYFKEQLEEADIGRVSFLFDYSVDPDEYAIPSIFNFNAQYDYREDALFRNIEPVNAHQLHLNRLSKNFTVDKLDSRQTSTINVHQYKATPRSFALEMDKKANKSPRIFVRALTSIVDFSSTGFEKMLVDSLNELDIIVHEYGFRKDNHLFINLMSEFERIVLDPVSVEQTIGNVLRRHEKRIATLGVTEVEIRLVCSLTKETPPIALRMVASNPTGYVHVMNTYVEASNEASSESMFKLIGGTKGSLASSGDSSWEGMKVSSPYPLTRPFDAQRNAALRSSDSLYCYDLPALIEAAVEDQWSYAEEKEGIEPSVSTSSTRPLMVTYTSELVVERKLGVESSGPWSMADYMNGDLELIQTQRRAGSNDVGMVAWLMTLHTVEYPKGRKVVLIANDITMKAGSFGTREDVVFKLASEYARTHNIPRLFVAANSGARIGLSESIKKLFKIAFKDESRPENGFDFLYMTKDDYVNNRLDSSQIIVEPATYKGEEVYKINDVIGQEPDLGVENLKGSGLIAGETSVAYNDIFTLTIVLGRTVGIGAYLVRLGQRTIQKTTDSPIILTGYQALNKLMGVDVYSTNDQLGGPGIMYSNGVSHMTVSDHLSAVKAAMEWLSFVPSERGALLPISHINGADSIDRPIDFIPTSGEPYDPRHLMTGKEDEDGQWLSGFFDKGSFVESLSGWAKSVVVGRARLGGIPMGVIATENRTAEATKPADPADVEASETIKQEAGCVWFPNSAYKTAQAINDFRTEDLPLIIFANWRGFSGGQRDMFEEVLKYGSMIVDAFVAFKQPVFVFIPPYAEIRGGAWVVVDASINSNVMEMYASETARGGVLEANGTATVKYREKDLLKTMNRIDDKLKELQKNLKKAIKDDDRKAIATEIAKREKALLPVYQQVAVQFCELHDTPGRMKAVGVIEKAVDWRGSRTYFFWRLRRKLAEFDLRKKIVEAGTVGSKKSTLSPAEASDYIKELFIETSGLSEDKWQDDKTMLSWMAEKNEFLEEKVIELKKANVSSEVFEMMVAGGSLGSTCAEGVIDGLARALEALPDDMKSRVQNAIKSSIFN